MYDEIIFLDVFACGSSIEHIDEFEWRTSYDYLRHLPPATKGLYMRACVVRVCVYSVFISALIPNSIPPLYICRHTQEQGHRETIIIIRNFRKHVVAVEYAHARVRVCMDPRQITRIAKLIVKKKKNENNATMDFDLSLLFFPFICLFCDSPSHIFLSFSPFLSLSPSSVCPSRLHLISLSSVSSAS